MYLLYSVMNYGLLTAFRHYMTPHCQVLVLVGPSRLVYDESAQLYTVPHPAIELMPRTTCIARRHSMGNDEFLWPFIPNRLAICHIHDFQITLITDLLLYIRYGNP